MLHPNVRIAASDIGGCGLAATEPLPAGTVIWFPCAECTRFSRTDQELLSATVFKWVDELGYRLSNGDILFPCRHAHYFNHSCAPNVLDYGLNFGIAVRTISPGEELTLDYTTFLDDPEFTLTCRCRASRCKGTISNTFKDFHAQIGYWAGEVSAATRLLNAVSQPLHQYLLNTSDIYRALINGATYQPGTDCSIRNPELLRSVHRSKAISTFEPSSSKENEVKTEIVVIGAGIIGSTIALEAVSRFPGVSLCVLDQGLRIGASHFSAGMHYPFGRSERVREMSDYSHDFYRVASKEHANFPTRDISMQIVSQECRPGDLNWPFSERSTCSEISSRRVHAYLAPNIDIIQLTGAHYANVAAVVARNLQSLRQTNDISVWEGCQVEDLRPASNGVKITLQDGRSIAADKVVLAPGPWAGLKVWREHTNPLGIRIKKIVAFHLDVAPAEDDPMLVFLDEDAFLLPVIEEGYWLFSYTCKEWDVVPDQTYLSITHENYEEARKILHRYAPGLSDRCCSGRVFCDAYSPNQEPIITPVTETENLIFAGAANGSGYRLAPAIAKEAVSIINLRAQTDVSENLPS